MLEPGYLEGVKSLDTEGSTMIRKALSLSIAIVALAAAAFALIPSTASASSHTPWSATEVAFRAGGAPRTYSLSCVSPAQMTAAHGGLTTSNTTILGTTFPYERRVLILNSICAEIGKWYWTAEENLTYGTVAALQTVMHEAQHTRGVRTEWLTECRSLEPTLTFLSHNDTDAYQMRQAREYLYHGLEKSRPAAYKLRGRCDHGVVIPAF